ncbi:MAG TPA: GNAT family N-acetyltransferase [Sphingomicrobium sp.]|nr:GNAT family N-acetyltransferase [Sphingomicrobium sp.]
MKALEVHLADRPTSVGNEDVEIFVEDVSEADATAIARIYAYHVLNGTASYEVAPPSVEATLTKIRQILANGWPFLVAHTGRDVVGYAYVTQFRDREAYRFTAENSIYIDAAYQRAGYGKMLMKSLIERSRTYGFRTMIAVIGGAEPASIALHSALGFSEVGRLKHVGFKFGRWLDSVYMQRDIA